MQHQIDVVLLNYQIAEAPKLHLSLLIKFVLLYLLENFNLQFCLIFLCFIWFNLRVRAEKTKYDFSVIKHWRFFRPNCVTSVIITWGKSSDICHVMEEVNTETV